MRLVHVVFAMAAAVVVASCVAAEDRAVAVGPDRTTFPVVSDLLDHRCGSIDCHGTNVRNLRIYGHEGLRLAATDRPSSKPNTTPAEYDETYLSLVALEPEIITSVVASGGASPERLTFLRKARGAEDHKGKQLWQEGDDADRCVTSWLADRTDTATCQKALAESF